MNNKIYSINLRFTEWLRKCDDLSDVKVFDMIKQIDPVVWNFFTILSLNKSKLSTFQKSFDFDWETQIYFGNLTITVEDSVLRRMLITCMYSYVYAESILLFTSSQLTELIDSYSRSSELIQVLNKFGVVVSRGTMSRCIAATVENLSEDKIKLQVHENHQSFKVAIVDNVDQNLADIYENGNSYWPSFDKLDVFISRNTFLAFLTHLYTMITEIVKMIVRKISTSYGYI